MGTLREEFAERHIRISLEYYGANDLATSWELGKIEENRDIFDDFYTRYPLETISSVDDFYLFLLSKKIAHMRDVLPHLIHDEHRAMLLPLVDQADAALAHIGIGPVVKFINTHYMEVLDEASENHDIRYAALKYIRENPSGISREVYMYLCEKHGYYLVDHFEDFEKLFEKTPALFDRMFPTGHLEEVNSSRLDKVLDIWGHILCKERSNLKDIIERNIPVLYEDITVLWESATVDNIMQLEGTFRHFHAFLKRVKSPLANSFYEYANAAEDLLGKHLEEQGQRFSYEIPVKEILEDRAKRKNWWEQLLYLTHTVEKKDETMCYISELAKKQKTESVLIDFIPTNIPTNDYFKPSTQQALAVLESIRSSTIFAILFRTDLRQEYLKQLYSVIRYISEVVVVERETLEPDVTMFLTMLDLVAENYEAEKSVLQAFCYSAATYICGLSEKLLRIAYIYFTKDVTYTSTNNIPLGKLLSEENGYMVEFLGEDHIKNLVFFFSKSQPNHVGHDYRNRLAHWDGISAEQITPQLVATLLWLFTDILNSFFVYLLVEQSEEEENETP